MDLERESAHLRTELNRQQRSAAMRLTIDPGFVNHRRIQTIVGESVMEVIDHAIANLPDLPDWMRTVRIDQIYARVLADFCNVNEMLTLGEILALGKGRLFCSTEELEPAPEVYTDDRA
jgi:hypothetical protein